MGVVTVVSTYLVTTVVDVLLPLSLTTVTSLFTVLVVALPSTVSDVVSEASV